MPNSQESEASRIFVVLAVAIVIVGVALLIVRGMSSTPSPLTAEVARPSLRERLHSEHASCYVYFFAKEEFPGIPANSSGIYVALPEPQEIFIISFDDGLDMDEMHYWKSPAATSPPDILYKRSDVTTSEAQRGGDMLRTILEKKIKRGEAKPCSGETRMSAAKIIEHFFRSYYWAMTTLRSSCRRPIIGGFFYIKKDPQKLLAFAGLVGCRSTP